MNCTLFLKLCVVFPAFLNRLEFDAYRSDLEELSMGPRDAVAMARIDAAQQQYQVHKEKYERLRSDVTIKLKFLEENKVSLRGRSATSSSAFKVYIQVDSKCFLCDEIHTN